MTLNINIPDPPRGSNLPRLNLIAMEALRIITQPVNRQLAINLPPSFSSEQHYEVIVLSIPSEESIAPTPRRKPSPKLAGTARLMDDLTTPGTLDSDWQLS